MKNQKLKINELLHNHKLIGVVSFITAVIIWLVISITQNPTREQIISGVPITINTENTAVQQLGLDVVDDLSLTSVNVRVSGPSYIVTSLTASDVLVGASLSDVNASGTYDLQLSAVRNSNKIGYDILEVSPSTITVTFDNIDTKTFDIVAVANGVKAENGLIADQPAVTEGTDSKIEITGPRKQMEKVAQVCAVSDAVKTIGSTESFDAKIVLLDEKGGEIDKTNFKIGKDSVKIAVPIYKKAEFNIKPVFVNAPAVYGNDVPCTLSETTVTVVGPPDVISDMTEVKLKPIDFATINSQNLEFDVELDLPTSVKTADNADTVHIKLNIPRVSEKNFAVSDIRFTGLSNGLTAKAGNVIKSVKICGPAADVFKLSSKDLFATVDLTGKAAGEYTVNAVIGSSSADTVWAYGNYTIIVTVSK